MPERAELASLVTSVDIRPPVMLNSRIAAVQPMTDLCSRAEAAKGPSIKREATKQVCASQGSAVDYVEVA